jgi:hypothetical protein
MTAETGLNEIILEAVDLGLLNLGETTRHTIYYHVWRIQGLKREEIPDRLDEFYEALLKLLGAGTKAVERLIVRSLYDLVGREFTENSGWTLLDYVRHVRQEKGMPQSVVFS